MHQSCQCCPVDQIQPEYTAPPQESFAARSSWPHPFGQIEETQHTPNHAAAEPVSLGSGPNEHSLGDERDWQPPARELGRFIPPGMVSAMHNRTLRTLLMLQHTFAEAAVYKAYFDAHAQVLPTASSVPCCCCNTVISRRLQTCQ